METRTTQERWEKLILNRDLIIQEANLKGADIPLNSSFPEIIAGIARITIGLDAAAVETLLDSILGEVVTGDYTVKGQAIEDAKEAIRQAIIAKEVPVPEDTPLSLYPAKIAAIEGGVSGHLVRFIDYDGTVLKEQIVVDGGAAIAPEIPAHANLTFTSWNNSFSVVTRDIDVGATYRSSDGLTHVFVTILPANQAMSISINKDDTSLMSIDFGNGDVQTTSESGVIVLSTTFQSGDYDIKIACSGSYKFDYYITNSSAVESQGVITKVILSLNVSGISSLVFRSCKSLSSINIPESITSIGRSAFYGCQSLKGLVIPNNVTTILDSALAYCYSLRNVSIPEGVTSIGSSAFSYNARLRSIIIPQSVTAIGTSSVFSYCQSLTSIKLPQGLTKIYDYCFSNCLALTDVQIPSGVDVIGNQAFTYCKSLSSLVLPDAITAIQGSAFKYCEGLQEINIPNGVTMIFDSAFSFCRNLSKITIPQSISAIYPQAFSYCEAVDTYVILKDVPPSLLNVSAFHSINYTCRIYVPDASVEAYKAATNWVTYANRIFPLSQLPV